MKTPRKPSNVTVVVPDLSAPTASALEAFNKQQVEKGELPASRIEPREFGYVLTDNGLFVLCREGVGDALAVTDSNKLELEFYPEWDKLNEEGKKFTEMGCVPCCTIELSDSEIIMLPTKSEEPLEQFIRQFGSRLESNYAIWLQHFDNNKPMAANKG